MSCLDIQKRLNAYVDQEVPAREDETINAHLEGCAVCRKEAEMIRRLSAALDALPPIGAPVGLHRKTLAAFRARVDKPSMAQWWLGLSLAMRSAVCAAALAGLMCGAVLGTRMSTPAATETANPYYAFLTTKDFLP